MIQFSKPICHQSGCCLYQVHSTELPFRLDLHLASFDPPLFRLRSEYYLPGSASTVRSLGTRSSP